LILIDFGRASLSQKPFPTTEPDFEAKLILKKIVNATKVPRTLFLFTIFFFYQKLEKFTISLRFWGCFPFPEAFPPPEPDLEPKSKKES